MFKTLVLQGSEEDGSVSKLVSYKSGDLSSNPHHHIKKLSVKKLTCNPSTGEAETGSLELAARTPAQQALGSVKDPVLKQYNGK